MPITAMLLIGAGLVINVADRVPRYDVKSTCRGAIKLTADTSQGRTEKNCLAGEEAARKNLAKDWLQFPSLERLQCESTLAPGSPSYVQLLSCLEMKRDVRKHREEEQRPAAEPTKSTDKN